MRMFTFKSFCCCCSLQTGGIILGIMGLMSSIANFFGALTFMSEMKKHEISTWDREDYLERARSVTATLIGGAIVSSVMHVSLIYGSYKKQRMLLVPWLATGMLKNILFGFGVFLISGVCVTHEELHSIGAAIFIVAMLLLAYDLYIWLCVYSLYREYTDQEQFGNRLRNDEVTVTMGPDYKYQNSEVLDPATGYAPTGYVNDPNAYLPAGYPNVVQPYPPNMYPNLQGQPQQEFTNTVTKQDPPPYNAVAV